MILSGLKIREEIQRGTIHIEPFREKQLNPNSYNLRLHDELLVYSDDLLDVKKPNAYEILRIPPEGIVLKPGTLYLGRTMEFTRTEKFVPMLEGRSSMGRLGLFVHVTAGFGDVGFAGFWTLEIHAVQPIRIYAGIEVCQIYYHTIYGDYETYSQGKYQNNSGIQPSLSWKDFQ
ncbi:MAG: dCTP deaminase [Planctomycetaceae bacterium]|nr:dCTP deaminase [Planctomycetaceae bacterium]MBQ2820334.1 dCTP deaminase [Thermoguttaceae bacterium]MDO4426123.1 dCTP deaminase [Planctomycetia bacterium]